MVFVGIVEIKIRMCRGIETGVSGFRVEEKRGKRGILVFDVSFFRVIL